MHPKDLLGRYGEQVAAAHLERAGLVVIDRNWRCARGEIDLVAREGSTLVFCEVKTRSGTSFGLPAEAVSATKARRLRRLAGLWLGQAGETWQEVRFDVVSVLSRPGGRAPLIEHVRGAF